MGRSYLRPDGCSGKRGKFEEPRCSRPYGGQERKVQLRSPRYESEGWLPHLAACRKSGIPT
ncbi:MAG: hypothetical protein ACYTFE_04825 [Planctomycetota bacterium]